MNSIKFFPFLVVIASFTAQAKLLENFPSRENQSLLVEAESDNSSDIFPTESQTQFIKETLDDKIVEGTYLALGTDRGFQAASFFPSIIDSLLLIDNSPNVVLFNRINIALLQMSDDLDSYRRLRRATSVDAWTVNEAKVKGELKDLLAPQYFSWWRAQADDARFDGFYDANKKEGFYPADTLSNYFNDEDQWDALKKLADDDRIQAEFVELKTYPRLTPPNDLDTTLQNLLSQIREQDLQLSVIDLSNLWGQPYLGTRIYRPIMALLDVTPNDAVVLFTTNYSLSLAAQEQKILYSYHGFRVSAIKNASKIFEEDYLQLPLSERGALAFAWHKTVFEKLLPVDREIK